MNHWPFIIGAYAATFLATAALLWLSLRDMRRTEAEANSLKGER